MDKCHESSNIAELGYVKTCLMLYANNKGADQPAHLPSLISAFVVRCLDSVMSVASVTKISSLMLASVADQAGLSLTLLETSEDTFSHDETHLYLNYTVYVTHLYIILIHTYIHTYIRTLVKI